MGLLPSLHLQCGQSQVFSFMRRTPFCLMVDKQRSHCPLTHDYSPIDGARLFYALALYNLARLNFSIRTERRALLITLETCPIGTMPARIHQ